MKNETINAFILGEPSIFRSTNICNQKKENTGQASEKEFPHVAIIDIRNRSSPIGSFESLRKCAGSLISDRHILTSKFCVSTGQNYHISVQLGAFNFDDMKINNNYFVESIEENRGVTILKLNRKVIFSEHVMPVCLFPDPNVVSSFLLVGWTGDWRDCNRKLKKWQIESSSVVLNRLSFSIPEDSIINYRQVRRNLKSSPKLVHQFLFKDAAFWKPTSNLSS